jgi:hypothetical protein
VPEETPPIYTFQHTDRQAINIKDAEAQAQAGCASCTIIMCAIKGAIQQERLRKVKLVVRRATISLPSEVRLVAYSRYGTFSSFQTFNFYTPSVERLTYNEPIRPDNNNKYRLIHKSMSIYSPSSPHKISLISEWDKRLL